MAVILYSKALQTHLNIKMQEVGYLAQFFL